jgi:hypothetical protein
VRFWCGRRSSRTTLVHRAVPVRRRSAQKGAQVLGGGWPTRSGVIKGPTAAGGTALVSDRRLRRRPSSGDPLIIIVPACNPGEGYFQARLRPDGSQSSSNREPCCGHHGEQAQQNGDGVGPEHEVAVTGAAVCSKREDEAASAAA